MLLTCRVGYIHEPLCTLYYKMLVKEEVNAVDELESDGNPRNSLCCGLFVLNVTRSTRFCCTYLNKALLNAPEQATSWKVYVISGVT